MPDVRALLLDELAPIPDDRVALLLSGGVDSLACGFALAELGKTVVAYSFMLDRRLSTDYAQAQRRAAFFGWDFHGVFLPTDLPTLSTDLLRLVSFGARKKTDFECGWPVVRALDQISETVVVTGHGADGHFCISKKGILHYKDRIDDFRRSLFTNPNYAQRPILERAAPTKTLAFPFLSPAMHEAFLGTSWDDVNRPKQKQPILDAFPQFSRLRNRPHTNLQLGDSGIADHFQLLLDTAWNPQRAKSPVAIYNALAAGRIKDPL